MTAHFAPPSRLAKAAIRPAFRLIRSLPLYAALTHQKGQGRPRLAFLPAYGCTGAARLRIYDMAQGLRAHHGWACLVLPPWLSLAERQRALRAFAPDLVVMQGARHVLNRPALYPAWPIVFDMDDADFHLSHLAGPVRQAMGHVTAVITGSAYIAQWCLSAGAPAAHVVWTGSPVSRRRRPPAKARPAVIAWAQTRPMTYGDEATFVASVMRQVAAQRPGLTLRLYDKRAEDPPDWLDMFRAPGLALQWRRAMAYPDYLASFDDVALGLAPLMGQAPFARGKSFGKVLAYLDRKLPVIASEAGEHGRFFTPETGVLSNDPQVWAQAILRLLDAPEARQTMADAAFQAFEARLSLAAAARATDQILSGLLESVADRGEILR